MCFYTYGNVFALKMYYRFNLKTILILYSPKASSHHTKCVSPKLYLIQWFYIFLKSSVGRFVAEFAHILTTVFSSTLNKHGREQRVYSCECEKQGLFLYYYYCPYKQL